MLLDVLMMQLAERNRNNCCFCKDYLSVCLCVCVCVTYVPTCVFMCVRAYIRVCTIDACDKSTDQPLQ